MTRNEFLIAVDDHVEEIYDVSQVAESKLLDHDASQRQRIEALEREVEGLKYQLQVHADLIGENEFSLRKQITYLTSQLATVRKMVPQLALDHDRDCSCSNCCAVDRLIKLLQAHAVHNVSDGRPCL